MKKNQESKEKILNQNEVGVDSFSLYDSSSDFTKEVDGKLELEDFHMYKEEE